ncbi:MAG: DUF4234 domain-containing protein [Actinomycetia bacterium]|nr:DUF4234 domain-containing protein [Actinomycetes bacterium]
MTAAQAEPGPSRSPMRGVPRPPWREWLLSVVTFGVYAAAHHYRTNRELRDYGIEVNPGKALMAFFPGGLILIPLLITVYRTGERIAVAQETTGLPPTASPEVSAVAALFALLHVPYLQAELNRAWEADAQGEGR